MVPLLVLLALPAVLADPSSRRRPTGFFPHPWNVDDFDRGRVKSIESNDVFSDVNSIGNDYIPTYKQKIGVNKDSMRSGAGYRDEYPTYSKEGFLPGVLSDLDKVSWWKRRYQGYVPSSQDLDLPFVDDDNQVDDFVESGFEKRDYTAQQLLNVLKAVARARRHRQVRIAGKGLRFGISK